MKGKEIKTAEDIQELIDYKVQESKTIEYKVSLPGKEDSNIKEFLADISSFANTLGGNILFGVEEEKGLIKSIKGLEKINRDQESLRIDGIIRNGIEPKITFELNWIETFEKKVILSIYIPKSSNAPHEVTYKHHDKFYQRHPAGKYILDVYKLKDEFIKSNEVINDIKQFYEERIQTIELGKTSVPLEFKAYLCLHIIPLQSFYNQNFFDIEKLKDNFENKYEDLFPSRLIRSFSLLSRRGRINYDGYVSCLGKNNDVMDSYVQIFRNGSIEFVDCSILSNLNPSLDLKFIHGYNYESMICECYSKYISILRNNNVWLPIYLFLTLINVKGYYMMSSSDPMSFGMDFNEMFPIDKNVLSLPELEINNSNIDTDCHEILKPLFNRVWNACGYSRSFNYDQNGVWVEKYKI